MTDAALPIPKYHIGAKVWRASTSVDSARYPCPDCLGTRKWACTSPAGHTMEMDCPRCSRTYSNNDALSLAYPKHTFWLQELTIGSVRIDTNNRDSLVSYMCNETGVGSGSVYDENELYATRDEAAVKQQALASARQTVTDVTPQAMERLDYLRTPYFGALVKAAEREALARIQESLKFEQELGAPTAAVWGVEGEEAEGYFTIRARTPANLYGVAICSVSGSDSNTSYLPSRAEAAANARLISAALEQNAALKLWLEYAETNVAATYDAAIDATRAALAKANTP